MATTYDVIVRLKSEGSFDAAIGRTAPKLDKMAVDASRVDSAIGTAGGAMSALGSAAGSVAGVFTGLVEKAAGIAVSLGKVGAVAALGAITYGVLGVNNELEKTQIGLAAVFGANGVTNNMTEGMSLAKSVMADMRRDAAALPGEFSDLKNFFAFGANPGLKAGANVQQIEKLSANAMAAAASLNLPMDQAAREFGMLMQGRAGAHNIFGTQMGINAKGFNSASGGERIKIITDALGKFEPAIAQFQHSWDGISSTFRDNAKHFLGLATLPLFEKLKTTFDGWNNSIDGNSSKLEVIASAIGGRLASAFGSAVTYIEGWWPSIETFASNAERRIGEIWEKAKPFVEAIGEKAKNFLGDPQSMDKIEGILKLYGAAKVGGAIFGAAGSMGNIAKGAGGMLASAAGDAASAGPLGAAAGLAVVEVAIVALAGAAFTAYGAFTALTDETSDFHKYAVRAWDDISAKGKVMASELSQAWDALEPVVMQMAQAFGTLALDAISTLAGAVTLLGSVAVSAANGVANVAAALGMIRTKKAKTGVGQAFLDAASEQGHAPRIQRGADDKGGPGPTKQGAGGGGGGTHIQKVEIVVNQNDDPSRVARHVVNRLADLAKNPGFSRYRPNYSTGNGPGY